MGVIQFYISIVLCISYFAVEETLADDYDTCLIILGHYFNFRDVHKTPRDCLEYAFNNLTMSTFDNDKTLWGRRYYAYLYHSIQNKKATTNPRKYCEDFFPSNKVQCIFDLWALGFKRKHGTTSLHDAYTILLINQLVEDAYSYKYYKHLIETAKLKDDIKTPSQWCRDGDYREDVKIDMRKRYSLNSSDNFNAEEDLNKYQLCLNVLQTYFQFSDVIKTPQDCLEHAYTNLRMLTFEGDNNVYGKRYHAYIYQSVVQNKNIIKKPIKYCEEYFPSKEEQCKSDLEELGFNHLKGIHCFKHAYTCLLDSELDKHVYSYKYYKYLIKTAKLKDGTKDPDQWCHDGDYVNEMKIDMRDRRKT